MNVTKPEKTKYSLKDLIVYGGAVVVCIVIALVVVAFKANEQRQLQEFLDPAYLEEVTTCKKTENQLEALNKQFTTKFNNNVEKKQGNVSYTKIDEEQDIVFTTTNIELSKENQYDIKCAIPKVNINTSNVGNINDEIYNFFKEKIEEISKETQTDISFSTSYCACLNDNILSLMIKANYKKEESPQKTIYKTYNYDVVNDKVVSLNDYLKNNQVKEKTVQKLINSSIKASYTKTQSLNDLGYTIYQRNLDDVMYNVGNVENYYVCQNTIYIIFAYGNSNDTSEMDLVIL